MDSQWLTTEEATYRARKSTKTLDRLVKAGELQSKLESRAGRKPERMYHAGDLERILQEGVQSKGTPALAVAVAPKKETEDDWAKAKVPLRLVESKADTYIQTVRRVPLYRKLFLTIAESVEYSGLSRVDIVRAIRGGKVEAVRSGGYKIKRGSLEALDARNITAPGISSD